VKVESTFVPAVFPLVNTKLFGADGKFPASNDTEHCPGTGVGFGFGVGVTVGVGVGVTAGVGVGVATAAGSKS
jgi:hypothetical protein